MLCVGYIYSIDNDYMQDVMRLHVPAVNNTKKLQNITICFLQLTCNYEASNWT